MEEKTDRTPERARVVVDEERLENLMLDLRAKQNLVFGILGGAGAALAGAVVWALLTVATGYQLGIIAIGIGFLVGTAVRLVGKGFGTEFGIAGAVLALLGCVGGNLLSVCFMIAAQGEVTLAQVLGELDAAIIWEIMKQTFHPMDIVFYAIAVYEGYRFSFRRLSNEELASCMKTPQ